MPLISRCRRWTIYACVSVLAALLMSCASVASELAEGAVEPAVPMTVEAALDEMTQPENEERLNRLLELEGLETSGHRVGRGLLTGMLSVAGDIDADPQMMETRTEDIFALIAEQLDEEISPILVALAASMTEAALDAAAAPKRRQQAALLAETITGAVMTAIADGLRGELGAAIQTMLVDEVGPGVELIVRDHLGPAIRDMLDDEFNAALGETARVVARNVAQGTVEGFEDAEQEAEDDTIVDRLTGWIGGTIDSLGWIFWTLVIVFIALALGILAWAARSLFQARDVKKKSDLRDSDVGHLAEELSHTDDDSEALRILRRLAKNLENDDT